MNFGRRGARWERLAESFLRDKGLRLLKRNFLCRWGEIDLVMADRNVTVFVEVRYRGPGSRLRGAESVDTLKQLKVTRAAGMFLARHPRRARGPCRFDVVAVDGPGERARLRWIRNAFDAVP